MTQMSLAGSHDFCLHLSKKEGVFYSSCFDDKPTPVDSWINYAYIYLFLGYLVAPNPLDTWFIELELKPAYAALGFFW